MTKQITNILFCEAIRQEMDGREMALGIYNGVISLPKLPVVLGGFIIRFECMFDGDVINTIGFDLRDPNGHSIAQKDIPLVFADWSMPGSVAANMQGLILQIEGKHTLYTRVDQGEWSPHRDLLVQKFDMKAAQEQMEAFKKMFTANQTKPKSRSKKAAPK